MHRRCCLRAATYGAPAMRHTGLLIKALLHRLRPYYITRIYIDQGSITQHANIACYGACYEAHRAAAATSYEL